MSEESLVADLRYTSLQLNANGERDIHNETGNLRFKVNPVCGLIYKSNLISCRSHFWTPTRAGQCKMSRSQKPIYYRKKVGEHSIKPSVDIEHLHRAGCPEGIELLAEDIVREEHGQRDCFSIRYMANRIVLPY